MNQLPAQVALTREEYRALPPVYQIFADILSESGKVVIEGESDE